MTVTNFFNPSPDVLTLALFPYIDDEDLIKFSLVNKEAHGLVANDTAGWRSRINQAIQRGSVAFYFPPTNYEEYLLAGRMHRAYEKGLELPDVYRPYPSYIYTYTTLDRVAGFTALAISYAIESRCSSLTGEIEPLNAQRVVSMDSARYYQGMIVPLFLKLSDKMAHDYGLGYGTTVIGVNPRRFFIYQNNSERLPYRIFMWLHILVGSGAFIVGFQRPELPVAAAALAVSGAILVARGCTSAASVNRSFKKIKPIAGCLFAESVRIQHYGKRTLKHVEESCIGKAASQLKTLYTGAVANVFARLSPFSRSTGTSFFN